MSRAVVTCSSSGRPEAFRNTVDCMPSWRALCVISFGEFFLAAGDVLGDGNGHVVGALGDQRLDGVDERDLFAFRQIQLGRSRVGGVGRDLDLGLVAQPALLDEFEGDVERHHLGERGRMAQLVGGARMQVMSGVGVYNQHRALGSRHGRLAPMA